MLEEEEQKHSVNLLKGSVNPEEEEQQSVEKALNLVGDNGFYQLRFLLIFFAQWMVSVFIFVGPVYYFPDPEFQCADGKSCTEDDGGCKDQILMPSSYVTITSDFKLYCDNRNLRSIAQSSLFWGPIFGNIFFSFLADWKGRRTSLIIAWTLSSIGIVGITFSYSIYQLIIMILLTGFSLVPCNNLNLIIVNEQSGEQFRQRGTTLLLMSWAIFEIILVPIAKYIQDWRNIFIYFLTIPAFVVVFLNYFFIFESPRFLLTKEQRGDMYKTLNKIAKTNNREMISEEECCVTALEKKNNLKIYTYFDLVKYKSLRMITAASCLVMFFTQMIYYATQYSLGSLGSDLYINTLVVGAGEVFAYFICNQFIHKFKRKLFTFIFYTSSILLCGLYFFVTSDVAQTVLAGFVRVFNCGTLGILALFVEELYPTTVRSLGVGAQMSIGVAGSSLAPIIIDQAKKLGINPLLATGVLSIPAIYTITFFSETKGKPLQDDISELQLEQKISQISQTQGIVQDLV